MPHSIPIDDLSALPVEDRLRLIGEIWDSITAVPEAVKLTEAQKQELDARLEAHRLDPTSGSPWPEVKKRLLQRP